MAESKATQNARKKLWAYRIAYWACLFLPLLIYVLIGLISDKVSTAGKVTLISMMFLAIVVTFINSMTGKHLRCAIWLLILGIWVAIKDLMLPLIIILAITSVLEDIFFSPMITHLKTVLTSNKAIDQREDLQRVEQEETEE